MLCASSTSMLRFLLSPPQQIFHSRMNSELQGQLAELTQPAFPIILQKIIYFFAYKSMHLQVAQTAVSEKFLVLPNHLPLPQLSPTQQHNQSDATFFKSEKQRYLAYIDSIRQLRLAEYLCKFIPKEKKEERIVTYNQLVADLCGCLDRLAAQAENLRSRFECQQKIRVATLLTWDFVEFTRKEVKVIADAWIELLVSIRKIPQIVKVSDIQIAVADVSSVDMYEWQKTIEDKLSDLKENGQKEEEEGCCFRWR